MGWIYDRHMRSGGSLNNNPRNNGSQKGPLRKIIRVLRPANDSFFGVDDVRFECKHEGTATRWAKRGRCKVCGDKERKMGKRP